MGGITAESLFLFYQLVEPILGGITGAVGLLLQFVFLGLDLGTFLLGFL